MTFLPIVGRELRVAARGRGLYHTRFWTAAGCLALAVYVFIFDRRMELSGSGVIIFNVLSYVGFLYCIGVARNTVDCISQEKREGTLGLLFLTDLKGYDVALGKLLANSLKSFNGVLAAVPVVCCALVMGGVSAAQVFHVVLALLNIFFFAHASGLLVSTYSREATRATMSSVWILIVYFMVNPAAVALLQSYQIHRFTRTLQLFDPGYAFREAATTMTAYTDYWTSLAVIHANAWVFLALASLRLPYCWQDKPRAANSAWRVRVRQSFFGSLQFRDALRRRLLDINPFLWLISRNRLGQITVWAMLGVMASLFVWAWREVGMADSMPLFVTAIFIGHGALKFWIAAESATHLEEQRFSGALEYLLSCTPLTPAEIIEGQWLALRRRFLGPVVAMLVFDLGLIVVTDFFVPQNDSEAKTNFTIGILAVMVMLLADAIAIGWLAMWRAMVSKRPRQASGQAMSRLLVLPWPIIWMIGPFMALFQSFYAALFLWFFVGLFFDAGFASVAKENLHQQFRVRAAVYQQERLGFLGRIGRALGRMTR